MKKYNSKNFHKHTFCLWKEVSQANFELQKSHFKSKSGSEYYFTDEGVYRISNHWGRVANCRWRLVPLTDYKNQYTKVGFARWNDFFPNDENAKLFFIQMDWEQKIADFFHKDLPFYDGKAVLRNAAETTKVLKTIKQVLNEKDWAKYLKYDDLEILKNEIVERLVNSAVNFGTIKKMYY